MKKTMLFACCLTAITAFGQDGNKVLSSDEQAKVDQALTTPTEAAAPKDTSWTTGGTLGLNFTQTYLDNWASGGQSSISGTVLVSGFAKYAKGNVTWDNTIDLAYGLLRQGDSGGVLKTDDRIDFSSKYGRKASEKWYYSALLNFRTQFAPGYNIVNGVQDENQLISDFLAPGYGLLALGMDYKPSSKFTAFISPLTYKLTVVGNQDLADAGAFGVQAAEFNDLGEKIADGENLRSELGGFVKMEYKTDLVENVSLQTRIDLFSNYANNPQNIDINWETLISMKINKYLSTTISTQLLYDDDVDVVRGERQEVVDGETITIQDVGPAVQFKEVLAIGFNYKF